MPKLDGLKWVPKLLNAYIDAKVEYETKRRLQEQGGTAEPEESRPTAAMPLKKRQTFVRPSTRRSHRSAVTRRTERERRRTLIQPLPHLFAEARAMSLAKGPLLLAPARKGKSNGGGSSTARQSQRQLERLETIRHQLSHLQQKLDRELMQLKKQMGVRHEH